MELRDRVESSGRCHVLAIPDDLRIVAGVTLGKAAPDRGWSRISSRAIRPRRGLDELVHWQRWIS